MLGRRHTQPSDLSPYIRLVSAFVERDLSAVEYSTRYFELFQADPSWGTPEENQVLGRLFTDADVFEPDPDLRRELIDSGAEAYDEETLRSEAARLLERLHEIQAERKRHP